MKITLELIEDNYPENKYDLVISDTETEQYKLLELSGKKYSVRTKDLIKLNKTL